MTDDAPTPEDLSARGQSIFQRLRSGLATTAEAPEATPDGEPAADAPVSLADDGVPGPAFPPQDAADTPPPDAERSTGPDQPAPPVDIGAGGPPEPAPPADVERDADPDQPVPGPDVGAGSPPEPTSDPGAPAEEPAPAFVPGGGVVTDPAAADVAGVAPAGAAPVIEDPVAAAPPESVTEEPPTEAAEPAPAVTVRTPRPLPRVMAIANQKGGVGKTTTAVNLSAALAELGYRVLVIDLDPQGNATTGLGINARNLQGSIYDVIMNDASFDDCIEPTSLRNLFVAPATIDLAGAEIELVPAFSRELKLRRAIDQLDDDYDYVLIDCPPSLGLLTINGLAAATEVLVPIQCEYYALEGLGQLLRNVDLVQGNLNPRLEVSTIVLTMYDARTKLAEQVVDEVRSHFADKVCRTIVPRTVRLSEAPSFGQPVLVFDPSSRGAIAYRELAKEVSGGPPQRTG